MRCAAWGFEVARGCQPTVICACDTLDTPLCISSLNYGSPTSLVGVRLGRRVDIKELGSNDGHRISQQR